MGKEVSKFSLYAEYDDSEVLDKLDIQTVHLEGGAKGVYNIKSADAFIKKHRQTKESWISIGKTLQGKQVSKTGVFDMLDVLEFVLKRGD